MEIVYSRVNVQLSDVVVVSTMLLDEPIVAVLYLGDELPRVMGYPSVCGGYCQHDRDCWDRNYCPRCNYDPVKLTYYCGK
uniref:Uncharacterized protein n=1 Tax=Solanum tuberosum TaxID=4113 RepID=M1ACN5_SOLTU